MENESLQKPKGYIGGQAVIEGVMMRGKNMYCVAVRNNKNEIELVNKDTKPPKFKILKAPFIRGILSFVDSMVIGMKIIGISAQIAGLEDENAEKSKFEKFLEDKFGDKLDDIIMFFSICISMILGVLLFILLPSWIAGLANPYIGDNMWIIGVIEGILQMSIFILYMFAISRLKDIQRMFMYHGAEHKTINCLESGQELTVENVKKSTRLHKRCGTSFLLLVMIISIVLFMSIQTQNLLLRTFYKILFVPVVASLSYEIIRWAGKNDSKIVDLISYPGLTMQKWTTKEPDDAQIEVAIAATKEVLKHE